MPVRFCSNSFILWHLGGRPSRISVRSWRRAQSDYHRQRWLPWRTERWSSLTACPMSHKGGICVMHQCHVQHAKFMPRYVGFVSFTNKIEIKHWRQSTKVPSVWLCFWSRTSGSRLYSACPLAAIQQSRLNGAQPNLYLMFQQFCYSHAVNLLAASHTSVVEQCGDGGCRIADRELHLATCCSPVSFPPSAGLVRAR